MACHLNVLTFVALLVGGGCVGDRRCLATMLRGYITKTSYHLKKTTTEKQPFINFYLKSLYKQVILQDKQLTTI